MCCCCFFLVLLLLLLVVGGDFFKHNLSFWSSVCSFQNHGSKKHEGNRLCIGTTVSLNNFEKS